MYEMIYHSTKQNEYRNYKSDPKNITLHSYNFGNPYPDSPGQNKSSESLFSKAKILGNFS